MVSEDIYEPLLGMLFVAGCVAVAGFTVLRLVRGGSAGRNLVSIMGFYALCFVPIFVVFVLIESFDMRLLWGFAGGSLVGGVGLGSIVGGFCLALMKLGWFRRQREVVEEKEVSEEGRVAPTTPEETPEASPEYGSFAGAHQAEKTRPERAQERARRRQERARENRDKDTEQLAREAEERLARIERHRIKAERAAEERSKAREKERLAREKERLARLERNRIKAEREEEERRKHVESLLSREAVRDHVNYMSGLEFEKFMADVLRQKGYVVEETKASGDQGVDLLLPNYDGKRVAVQLKRYTGAVGNSAIQQTFAGMAHYHAEEGWVITTGTFTKSARQIARSTRVRLIDGKELADWLVDLKD
ncbi:MAG: hypothetical protein AVDCRST_MAG93-4860 [uncultured Chloroflexia bacterium]|uniref:Restriction endonuclease type IV Mrr domain-containing protein n=1 Tax=uncultured Chloroflexia bacterium TaxID=1672391 RepID=A0A6J4KG39_9CHLR|nr:MAG: hypothetical protein AVDCRST_MAG93-4860 [uncultured Chloroflexia bacterium]